MKQHKPLHIYDETFRKNYFISYGVSVKQIQKAVNKQFGSEWNVDIKKDEQGKCMLFELPGATAIWVWTKYRRPWVLAHECLHACYYCFGEDRVRLDGSSQELWAYSIEMLMRKILKKGGKNNDNTGNDYKR